MRPFDAPMNATALPYRSETDAKPSAPRIALSRNMTIALSVVALHVAFIWALQSGLIRKAAEVIVPAEILVQFIDPPAPKVEPVKPTPPAPVVPKKQVTRAPVKPQPQPLAIQDNTPSPNAPAGVTTPVTPSVSAPVSEAPSAPAAPPAPPAPPVVQMPSSDADYLQNPRPSYPAMSKRLNEQGRTVISVLIGTDGLPQQPQIARSSGYDRLDQAALTTVMRWRFVPGKRDGAPQAMRFNVPINWVLE